MRNELITLDDPAGGSERAEVSLTSEGLAELRRRIERQLLECDPDADPKFMIALAYLGALTPGRATYLLRERAQHLQVRIQELTDTLNRTDVPELHMIEVHFLTSRLEHDAAWLTRLAERIRNGELNWPTHT